MWWIGRMMQGMLVGLMLAGLAGTPAFAGFDEGLAAYKRQDYATALREWWPLAEQGDDFVQYNLGLMFYDGEGVPQDYGQAMAWFRKGAEQGNVRAQNSLGVMHAKGQGVPQDYKQAAAWYRKAAEQGDATAQSNLGLLYASGKGFPQDYSQAADWLRKAAEQGDVGAKRNLAVVERLESERQAAHMAQQAEASRKHRAAASSQPSEEDVVRILVAEKAGLSRQYRMDEPDTLVKMNPVIGELARIRFSISGLRCESATEQKGVLCRFAAESKIVGGFLGPLAPLAALGGNMPKNYSVRFLKGKTGWYSPELSKVVLAEHEAAMIKDRIAKDQRRRAEPSLDPWDHTCRQGNIVDKNNGAVVRYAAPECN